MWWNACCATYATRQFGCFQTSPLPLSGISSPVSSLIIVDLPAPLAPMHAARVESETRTVTPVSCAFGAPGYVKVMFVIFMMCFPFEVMPSRLPGCGKRIVNFVAFSSKYESSSGTKFFATSVRLPLNDLSLRLSIWSTWVHTWSSTLMSCETMIDVTDESDTR